MVRKRIPVQMVYLGSAGNVHRRAESNIGKKKQPI
jgi:hypothetical protein